MVSSTIFMKRNDTRPFLDTVLQDVDGLALDLSGSEVKTIKFTMVDADSFIIKVNNSSNVSLLPPDDGVSDDGSDGKVRYSWTSADTDVDGVFLGEFQITYTNGDQLTVPTRSVLTIVILEDYDNA